jgi:hypothetical protein
VVAGKGNCESNLVGKEDCKAVGTSKVASPPLILVTTLDLCTMPIVTPDKVFEVNTYIITITFSRTI